MTSGATKEALARIPPRLHRLCDDASMLAPRALPVADALREHVAHSRSDYRRFLGPLVVTTDVLDELDRLSVDLPERSVWVAVMLSSPTEVADAMRRATAISAVRLAGAEIALPDDMGPEQVVPEIARGLDDAGVDFTEVYVEMPRDERRAAVLDALADSDFDAAFRIGGGTETVDEADLADTVLAAVSRHLPFNILDGLHHAVRTTDPSTGVEQHGFLNLFLAVDAARQGVGSEHTGLRDQLIAVLGDRDAASVARRVKALGPERALSVRASFTSLGTCSIREPLAQLVDLGLIDRGQAAQSR